jgi:hypothetical protein
MKPIQTKAIGEVCYLPEETIDRGGVAAFGPFSVKLTVNAGFE